MWYRGIERNIRFFYVSLLIPRDRGARSWMQWLADPRRYRIIYLCPSSVQCTDSTRTTGEYLMQGTLATVWPMWTVTNTLHTKHHRQHASSNNSKRTRPARNECQNVIPLNGCDVAGNTGEMYGANSSVNIGNTYKIILNEITDKNQHG